MIRIRTPSRLHFGLFSLPSAHASGWPNHEGQATLPRRNFGGVGLMIDRPGVELTVKLSHEWSIHGPLRDRAATFANDFCSVTGIDDDIDLCIHAAAPEHFGLGTGTQLGMAVARAIAELVRLPRHDAEFLACRVKRGLRSALGVHGFERGGFLVEAGKTDERSISPLVARHDFPADWRILLVMPRGLTGAYGPREAESFTRLAMEPPDDRTTDSLCRLVLLGMLPALTSCDLAGFGEAVYDFNRRVGEMFRMAQGGVYAHPRIEALVKSLRDAGVKGVGQSSWGPTTFAIVASDQTREVRDWLLRKCDVAEEELIVTSACNHGAVVSLAV